ncbi:diaminopimelate decarboxylase [Sporolactobacillus spathodeae]|uniref:Diaminopimelate decarboxylase n=1 Tax=Sporolactobacillus spathodeae TaxID=1465502 RepID=A0ABS2QA50_9BACL|nr:diaminopimelate decarboxylase [Sporolactobacillus spathodeae]
MFGTQIVNNEGHLMIGGCDTVDLANEFGTPLYIYDTALIKEKIEEFKAAFSRHKEIDWQIAYASKAFSTLAMVQLIDEAGLALDVVSGGELYTALHAGMPASRIHFHGNNKSDSELRLALDAAVGAIVVDNFYELDRLNQLCAERRQSMDILLRVTPGVEAHTHEFIMTGHDDTKFGFNLDNGMAEQAIRLALESSYLILKGLHCHIGSQIFETEGFAEAIRTIYKYLDRWSAQLGFSPRILNVGGGFGIHYTELDHPLPIADYIDTIVATVREECDNRALPLPAIWVEPGRSLVGEAGTTLYTAGATKEIPGTRTYLSVDGGMADNIRPSLYQADYQAICASRANLPADKILAIAGKCCETGDILIKQAHLPAGCTSGDILAVLSTGAYGYSMASHYNRLPAPAVVFVEDGDASLVVRRETYADIIRLDVPLQVKTHNDN